MVVLYFSIKGSEDRKLEGNKFVDYIKKSIIPGLFKKVVYFDVNCQN
jgi:hypothetical protein